MRRDVFQAISDPTRREIIQLIAGQSLNLNSVADKFSISRPAVSRHIRILRECGLVVVRQVGRERFCEPSLKPLNEVSQWVERYKIFWTTKLDALESFLDQNKTPFTRKAKRPTGKAVMKKTFTRVKNTRSRKKQ
jgi:DNA-binding transcriptional ArsR family regulator